MRGRTAYRPYGGTRKRRLLKALIGLLVVGTLGFAALQGVIFAGGRTHIEGAPKTMIILGCQVKSYGPSELLLDRLDTALAYLTDHPEVQAVVSGGQGEDEPTTEAAAMAAYLVAHGIDETRIFQEDKSRNTYQNLVNSFALLKEKGGEAGEPYIIVSNSFHLARAKLLADRMDGGAETYTLAAPTSHLPSRVRMWFREPFALVKSVLFDQ